MLLSGCSALSLKRVESLFGNHALGISNKESRIIITTRNEDVASLDDDEHCIQLKTLGRKKCGISFVEKPFQE